MQGVTDVQNVSDEAHLHMSAWALAADSGNGVEKAQEAEAGRPLVIEGEDGCSGGWDNGTVHARRPSYITPGEAQLMT